MKPNRSNKKRDPFVGKIIGKTRILKCLGIGGMGAVYKAQHISQKKVLAIKILHNHLAYDQDHIRRFLRESNSTMKLDSPHIIKVYDAGWDQKAGVYYIHMELIEGESIAFKLRREKRIDMHNAIRYLEQIARGLEIAHATGIFHRDIKPENIMIDRYGIVKIADFGLAKMREADVSALTQTGQLLGTASYMAPEQFSDNTGNAQTDIYAMGVTFYQMLTGKLPFDAPTPLGYGMRKCSEDPPSPQEVKKNLPEEINELTLRMIAREPKKRYLNISQIRQEIALIQTKLLNKKPANDKSDSHKTISPIFEPTCVDLSFENPTCLDIGVKKAKTKSAQQQKKNSTAKNKKKSSSGRRPKHLSKLKKYLHRKVAGFRKKIVILMTTKSKSKKSSNNKIKSKGDSTTKIKSKGDSTTKIKSKGDSTTKIKSKGDSTTRIKSKGDSTTRIKSKSKPRIKVQNAGKNDSKANIRRQSKKTESARNKPAVTAAKSKSKKMAIGDKIKGVSIFKKITGAITPDNTSDIPGFKYLGEKNYRCGKIQHVVKEYQHVGDGTKIATKMKFVLIPAGTFRMGNSYYPAEQPEHEVLTNPFLISKYVVTQKVWRRVMKTRPWLRQEFTQRGENYPATYIDWHEAQKFCVESGLALPSESQWERACRADSQTKYYWGKKISEKYCWYKEKNSPKKRQHCQKIGKKLPNAFGLHDMLGNLYEWCEDVWHANYRDAPAGGRAWIDGSSTLRVIRGGGWDDSHLQCRCSYRNRHVPDSQVDNLGFRLVYNLEFGRTIRLIN